MTHAPTVDELVGDLEKAGVRTQPTTRAPKHAEVFAQTVAVHRQRLTDGAGAKAPRLRHYTVEATLDPVVGRVAGLLGKHSTKVAEVEADKGLNTDGRKTRSNASTKATRDAALADVAKERAGVQRALAANSTARGALIAKALPVVPKDPTERLLREIRNGEVRARYNAVRGDDVALATVWGGLSPEAKAALLDDPLGTPSGALMTVHVKAWKEGLVAGDPDYVVLREQGEDLEAIAGALDGLAASVVEGLGKQEPSIEVVGGEVKVG
jgi:hypothetical protein